MAQPAKGENVTPYHLIACSSKAALDASAKLVPAHALREREEQLADRLAAEAG